MNYVKISSPSNPSVKEAIRVREKRSLHKHETFLIEGTRVISMALDAGVTIKKVFFTSKFLGLKEGKLLLSHLSGQSTTLFEVTDHVLKKLTDTETPQGIAAMASCLPVAMGSLRFRDIPLVVVVDGIKDPGNLGTIIRTSDAAGVDAVILLPGTCDAFMPKTVRATAGSIFSLPISYTEASGLLKWVKLKKIMLAVTSANTGRSIFSPGLQMPLALVFGNETRGVSEKLERAADVRLRIPLLGKAESLNVAAASAVCLYEAVRQRRSEDVILGRNRTFV